MQGMWRERAYEIHTADNGDLFARVLTGDSEWLFVWIHDKVRATIPVEHVSNFETFITLCGFFSDPHVFNLWYSSKRTSENG